MACPNCDHTMQCLGETPEGRHFWCSRCGTIKTCRGNWEDIGTPSWIERTPLLIKEPTGKVREADNSQEALNAYTWGCVERKIKQLI